MVQQRSSMSNSNELLIVPGIDKVKQLFTSNVHIQSGQGGPSMSDDVTRGVDVGEAVSKQEGVDLNDTAQEVEVEHGSLRADDEHAGSQQLFDDTDLGRTTNTLDVSSQAEEVTAEATHGDEGSDPDDSNGSGRTTSALSGHEHDVSRDEGGCENEEVGETRVLAGTSTEAEIEAAPLVEENMSNDERRIPTVNAIFAKPGASSRKSNPIEVKRTSRTSGRCPYMSKKTSIDDDRQRSEQRR
ncbi:hypothetical protein GQ457_12G006950 [Hibiscus cannabinus]